MHPLADRLLLLVEDNPQLAQAMTTMIEGFGGTVIHAHSAEEALELLSEIQLVPDAMLIDYQLGAGLNGTQLLQEIIRRYGPVPAAIVSAERTKVLREACKELGVKLIPKPVERAKLKRLLAEISNRD
jgi:CheY-like chemotaxis protein